MSDPILPASVEAVRELPEEIARAIDDLLMAGEDMGASYNAKGFPAPEREEVANEYCAALTTAILSRLTAAEASRDVALARAERLESRVNAALDDSCRMSAILLMAGEMTAQERRTARAVANGLAAKVRSALSSPAATEEG